MKIRFATRPHLYVYTVFFFVNRMKKKKPNTLTDNINCPFGPISAVFKREQWVYVKQRVVCALLQSAEFASISL